MKKLLFIITSFVLLSCTKEKETDVEIPKNQLPPETQIGANTFGCIINNQVFYPRDGQGSLFVNGTKGLIFWGDHTLNQQLYNEIEIKNAKDGIPCAKMVIHLHGLNQYKEGEYIWKPTNFQNSIDGLMQNYVYAKILNPANGTYKYYGSYENSGKVTITKYALNNTIVSGNFRGKLRQYNSTEEIEVLNGRFDINKANIETVVFP